MIIRHGFSSWNEKNLFTGWVDVELTDRGREEAKRAGKKIKESGFNPNVLFTSVLKRAIETADIVVDELGVSDIETHRTWRLNERHYGALTGLDKKATVEEFGEEQVLLWRRSFDVPPPALPPESKYDFSKDPLYVDVPCALIPQTECLKDVIERVLPYFEESIAPRLLKGENVLVVAHGNSLRALIMHIEKIAAEEISNFELPTGTPRLYEFDERFALVKAKYLEDEEVILERQKAVKNQTSTK